MHPFLLPTVLVFSALCVSFAPQALAAGERIDLTSGIVFPTGADAVALNPASLGGGGGGRSGGILDGRLGFGGNHDTVPALFYSNAGSSLGWGLGARRIGDETQASAAFGFALGQLQLGFGAESIIRDISPSFTLGLRYGGSSGLYLAAATYGFTESLDRITGGLGFRSSRVRGELNLDRVGSDLSGSAALAFEPSRSFTFLLGADDSVDPFFGINLGLGSSASFYFLYHRLGIPYAAGAQIAL